VRDEKKLATHDVQNVAELFSLADKCARAVGGRAWHMPPTLEVRKVGKPNAGATAQGSGNNNKKKAGGNNQPLAGAPTAAIVARTASGG
jgi:hypothetical protein